MSESCCSTSTRPGRREPCPRSGFLGKPVDWLTVAALTRGAVPPRQEYWLCRDPDCELVYFSRDHTVLRGDLTVDPGFKAAGDGFVCYCFRYRRSDIERELAATGETTVSETIRAAVRAGNCACEVRNPAGKCCLGEVERAISGLRADVRPGGSDLERPQRGTGS